MAILSQGEVICSGSLNELLGSGETYYIKGRGGESEVLKQWIPHLTFDSDGSWHGTLQEDYYDFLASLRLMKGQIISINLSRHSLEEFFMQQLQQHKSVHENSSNQ